MAQFFAIHPDNPQERLIKQAVEIVNKGGVVVYPTDSCYALGCKLGDKAAMERILSIRKNRFETPPDPDVRRFERVGHIRQN